MSEYVAPGFRIAHLIEPAINSRLKFIVEGDEPAGEETGIVNPF